MKKKMRNLFSVLLVLLLALQVPGLSAGADGVTGEESLSYVLYTTPDETEPLDQEAGPLDRAAKPQLVAGETESETFGGDTCSVQFGDTVLTRAESGIRLKDLLDKASALTVRPPEGYYVKALAFCGEDPESGMGKDLLLLAEADLQSAKVSVPGEVFFDESGSGAFNASLLPSPAGAGSYKLYVQVEKITGENISVSYALGDNAPLDSGAPAPSQPGEDQTVTVSGLGSELRDAAKAAHKRFGGWKFTYSNGTSALAEEGNTFKPYESVQLTAQWSDEPYAEIAVEAQSITYGDLPSPELNIHAQGYEVNQEGKFFTYLDENGEEQSGRLPAGSYTVQVSGLSVTDAEGGPVEDYTVTPGRLTVNKRAVSVTANSPVNGKEAGYSVNGLLPEDSMDVTVSVEESGGQYVAKASGAVITDGSGADVTGNYEIQYTDGSAEIPVKPSPTPAPPARGSLTIRAKDRKTEYTGALVTAQDYTVTSGTMASGDKIVKVTYDGGSVNVTQDGGVTCYPDKVVIEDNYGNDVTGEYDLTLAPGTVTVTAKKMTVTAKDVIKDYDGEAFSLKAANLEINGKINTDQVKHEVRVGFQIMQNGKKTSAVKAGTYTIDITSVQVVDEDGNDVSGNYSITMNDGKLTVNGTATSPTPAPTPTPTPAPTGTSGSASGGTVKLTVTADSGVWQYDGSAHTLDTYKVTGLQPGDKISSVTFANNSNTITDAGTQSSTISSVSIVDSKNNSANYKYNITLVPGTLTVSKAPLTLTAESATKNYDGKELENKNVSVSKLANDDHKLSVRFNVVDQAGNTTKAIEPGTYTKEITSYTIMDGSEDVSKNYDVKLVDGTLTVLSSDGSPVEKDGPESGRHGAGLGVWVSILLGSALILGGGTAGLYFYTRKKKAGPAPRNDDGEINLFESIFKKKK